MIYILKRRVQHLLVLNNAPPHIKKPLHNRRLPPNRGTNRKLIHMYMVVFYV